MGGYQSEYFIRLGIGSIFVADIGTFDASNINRQWAAKKESVGVEKALASAREMRKIADDYHLYVCMQGLNEGTADFLIKGRDVVVDMIEFWSLADRIWLHRKCAEYGVVAINCNSYIHSSFGTRFDYTKKPSTKMLGGYVTLLERALKMTYERARELQGKYEKKTITQEEKAELMEAVMRVFMPEETELFAEPDIFSSVQMFRKRLLEEGKAPVISVNPPFAAGWCATEVYFEILRQKSPRKRAIRQLSAFPVMTKNDIGKKQFKTINLFKATRARRMQNTNV
jgi:hypothetical protein